MTDIRPVTSGFAVAPQLAPNAMQDVAARGFKLVINNRPDGEVDGQPTSADMERAARAAGLDYAHMPVVGGPKADQVAAMQALTAAAEGPTLAFCRSGTRSIVTWALGQAQAGRSSEDLVQLGSAAGYDLTGVVGA